MATTTEADIEQLRNELQLLKQSASADKVLLARKLRAQVDHIVHAVLTDDAGSVDDTVVETMELLLEHLRAKRRLDS